MRTCCQNLGGNWTTRKLRRFHRDDAGSLTIFSLFIFLMILMVAGVAVDMMRYENDRVGVQNTLDTAVIAATSLNQDADTDEEVTALVKSYFEKAGYDPDIVQVSPNIETPAGGTEETLRTVSARVDFSMNTAFMNMLGIDTLPGIVGGGAREGQQLIEIAMILDISGSMQGRKLEDMKDAAQSFVNMVLTNNGTDRVMISIIPYNGQVHMTSDLMNRIALNNAYVELDPAPTHPGAITAYNTRNPESHCVRFLDADFDSLRLAAGAALEPSAKFRQNGYNYYQPSADGFFCGTGRSADPNGRPEMLLYQNDYTLIYNYIEALTAGGWTAIDYGMKWGVGVLDPSFRPIVQDMLADSQDPDFGATLVPDNVAGHPVNYATENVYKYIVLMTDGANTEHRDLGTPFKSGPSRIWFSEERANGNEWNGYLVNMPNNLQSARWYAPGSPWTTDDDTYLSQAQFDALDPNRVNQRSYHDLYNRFAHNDVANYFFRQSDWNAYNDHRGAQIDTGGYGTADTNLARICDKAQENGWIEVFAVAFEAPQGGTDAMQRCVQNNPGNFFPVAGEQLTTAFNAIAAEITKLRLTQ